MPLRDTLGELVKEIQGWLLNILRKEYWEDNFRTSLIGLFKVYGLVAPWLCVCCVNSWVLLVFFK